MENAQGVIMRRCAVLLVVFAVCAVATEANERVSIRVTPAVSFAPADLNVRAMVDVNAANRSLEVIAESQEFYRSSEIQLEGDHAPRTTNFSFRNLPGGDYTIRVIVRGSRREMIGASAVSVNVVERGR